MSDYNAFSRAWWLIGEHAAVDLRAANAIRCDLCSQLHDAYGDSTTQGHCLCAWALNDNGRWVIHCGYGSDFDLSEFWFIDNYPTRNIERVCDWCIRRMLRDGTIIDSGKECEP